MDAKNVSTGDWLLVQVDLSDARGPTAIRMKTVEDFTTTSTSTDIEEKKNAVTELPPI